MEDATDYAVAELGDAVLEVWNCKAKREKARVLDLEAVVEDRDTNRSAALRIVRVRDGVDHGLSYGDRREVPAILTADAPDLCTVQGVLLDERDRGVDRGDGQATELCLVEDLALVESVEAPGLNPRIGKVVLTVSPEQQDPTNRRDDAALMRGDEPQRLQGRASGVPGWT